MILVIDASAAVEIALDREKSCGFSDMVCQADLVLAPDIFSSEITNVFWKYTKLTGMPKELSEKGIAFCIDLVDDFIETKTLCREVFAEAIRTGHPAYNLFYLIVARRQGALVLTRDKKMRQLAKTMNIITPE